MTGENGKEMTTTDEGTSDRLGAFVNAIEREIDARGALPEVEVRCDFSYTLRLARDKASRKVVTVPEVFVNGATFPFRRGHKAVLRMKGDADALNEKVDFKVLSEVDGCFRPGTLTLLLAPPGHGKSSLLKSIAGVGKTAMSGQITYSGLTADELKARGICVNRLCEYVTQVDEHLPFLTVQETVKFSHENACVVNDRALYDDKVNRVIQLLNLDGCKDTIIGNNLIRGVSGGEKKRVTIAEAMVKNAQVLCMDEISTGLDAAVTYNIIAGLKEWAIRSRGTAIIALLQPTPEVVALFDEVLLLKEGAPVYHGPMNQVEKHFRNLGYTPPAAKSGTDLADWLVSMLVSPKQALYSAGTKMSENIPTSTDELAAAWRSTDLHAASSQQSRTPSDIELKTAFSQSQFSYAYPRSYGAHFSSVFKRQAQITLRNKLFLMARIFGACVVSFILGSVWFDLPLERGFEKLGMLLFCILHISFANFAELTFSVEQKFVAYKHLDSKLFPEVTYLSSWTFVHLPIAVVETLIFSCVLYPMVGLNLGFNHWAFFYFQLLVANIAMASFFRVIALLSKSMEVAQTYPGPFIAIMILFAGFLISPAKMGALKFMYWVSLFAYALRSLCQNEFLSGTYDTLVPNDTIFAQAIINNNPAYAGISYAQLCSQGIFPCSTMGEIILRTIGISSDTKYLWGGPGFCLGFFVLTFVLGLITLHHVRIQRNIGSSRVDDRFQDPSLEKVIQMVDGDEMQKAVSFTPMAISWKDLCYTVEVAKATPKKDGDGKKSKKKSNDANEAKSASDDSAPPTSESVTPPVGDDEKKSKKSSLFFFKSESKTTLKQLLHNVSSAAQPGRMLALMGSSGAGKTTLLDVIAGRKNTGFITGEIKLNGHGVKKETFARLTAYCEQVDLHNEFATVREALEFSAKLRLDKAEVSSATRAHFVDEALTILELDVIANRMIGSVGSEGGLAPGQRKVLTVAVELVSNAPVFFLDEPTSGLDSRSALIVMKEVKKVASQLGRTVISTIHQPSMEVFIMFDDMLLLQRGGYQVYFGALGPNGSTMVSYLQSLPIARTLPAGMNPASWMLDVLSGSDSSGASSEVVIGVVVGSDGMKRSSSTGNMKRSASGIQLDGLQLDKQFNMSPQGLAAAKLVDEISLRGATDPMFAFTSPYARSFKAQFSANLVRAHRSQLRDTSYNCGRIGILTILYILFGVIYLDIDTSDEAGVQSLVACIFMTTIFTGIIAMNSVMPVRVRERAVAFRERSSYMYGAISYSLSQATIEIPWILLISFLTVIPMYFLVGLIATPERLFFHILINFLVSFTFLSIGQAAACIAPTIETAQAVASALIPIFFLFGGLYLPEPQIPVYWIWAYYINPVSYAIQSVVAPQFERIDCTYPNGTCPTIEAFRGTYTEIVDTLDYVEAKYNISFADRWYACLYLSFFVVGMQVIHNIAFKTSKVVKR